jgi:arylsulfatase A-like enzyme
VNESPKDAGYHGVPWYVVVREDRWKLIRYLETGVGEELYDLKNDPEELTNVVGKPEHKEVLERLRKLLKEELKRTDAGFE